MKNVLFQMGFRRLENMVVIVIAAAACASVITASITDNDKRISEDNKTTEYNASSQSYDKSIGAKKVIQRLIGGHVNHKKDRENWDDGIMMSSAGNGKEKTRRDEDEEEKKTLSQQVKEGKYGLIQNEIYPKEPKRPGIISYLGNPEVPKDTRKNYGGLEEDEIWLAENHLLVLRGGRFPDHGTKPVNNGANWPPIDDYKAPPRQVKIPNRPKVPPPFPVQLTEGGPVQIIRANGSVTNVNDTTDYDEYANYPEGFYPGEAPFYPAPSNSTELGPNSTEESYPGAEGTVGPFYPALPPGTVYLPAPNNQSEYEDEDQSIYYPPPYSFQYKQDNDSAVPAGPLVPGIILPPPPNFFASLDDEEKKPKKTTTTEVPETTTYPSRRKTTKPYKSRLTTTTTTKPRYQPTVRVTSTPRYETTTLRPEKPTTISQTDYYDVRTEVENHLIDLGAPQGGQWSAIVGSTAVPLLAYYATTTSPVERTRSTGQTREVEVKNNGNNADNNQASYYYYEETTNDKEIRTTTTPAPPIYYKTNTEAPSSYYNVEPISTSHRKPKKQYYSVEMIPSQQTRNNFDVKPNYNEYIQPQVDNGQRYYQPTVKPYYTTQRPRYYYQTSQNQPQYDYRDDQELKSNPVYQYSYETTDYAKGNRESYQNQEIREDQGIYDYQQPPSTNGQYYDYDTQPVEKQKTENPYLKQRIVNTTPNPQHAYYTKQDEQLLDDVTKQYFTIFGNKLADNVLPSTTPLYRVVTTTENPISNVNSYVPNQYNPNAVQQPVQHFKPPKVKVHYGDQTQRPFSLEGDTLVNYKNPLPPINPDAEFISVPNKPQRQRQGYRTEPIQNQRESYRGRYRNPGPTISLANDIAVNYRDPRPPINPDAEFINPAIQQLGSHQSIRGGGGGSYFAYQLPGNGGHFYFLTPQAISQRDDINRGRYIYSKPTSPRIIRRRRGPTDG